MLQWRQPQVRTMPDSDIIYPLEMTTLTKLRAALDTSTRIEKQELSRNRRLHISQAGYGSH